MRILHLGKYYSPYKGGIETVTQSLAEGLQKKGHEVTVLCSSTEPKREIEEIRGVEIIRLPTFGTFASQPLTPSFFMEIGKLSAQFDIVHVHSPNPLVEAVCTRLPEDTRLVCTYHCEVVRQKILKRFYQPIQVDFLKKCQRVIVSSPQTLEFSEVLPKFAERTEVIPFGISDMSEGVDEEIEKAAHDLVEQYGVYHLFVGRLVGYKGLEVLLHSLTQNDQKVIIVGVGPEEESLKGLARDLGLSERVLFKGSVEERREFLALFKGACSFVLPSISEAEAFGMVLLEAMSLSLPVISTQLNSGVSYVNQHEASGLQVPAKNEQALSDAMERMAGDETLRSKLSKGARNRYEKMFSQSAMAESHIAAYNSLFGLQG